MQSTPNSEIIHHAHGGMTLAGSDAINLMRAVALRAGMQMYARTGIKLTRTATPATMLAIAKEYTGKDYKGKDKYVRAIADLDVWIATMKAALPITDNRSPESEEIP